MFRNAVEPWHLLVVAVVIIAMFGSKKLPDTARAVGKSMRILKSETKAMKEEGQASYAAPAPAPAPAPAAAAPAPAPAAAEEVAPSVVTPVTPVTSVTPAAADAPVTPGSPRA
ncbi:Sec-independent protein translocase subunit TatA [Streptomyces paludis]|uniref:Sec-independent protein translocase protein TatA n=1 Tax=Streptomyces paludis TaxID=2282738 RepID=A0A345HPP9_9ACTN|nr:Sec-independent protein translocase subunit TatA [Streptomyces paludis]AXG78673.1 twin-arginine translocase TatA/TatE family subunit [Streptomyces paludis]